jgi:amino acid adenylation domain-containing protein
MAPGWAQIDVPAALAGPETALSLLAADSSQPSYEEGPLVQACLAVVSPEQHLFAIRVHSLCADTTAMANLMAEVASAYHGRDPVAPRVQYADVSEVFNDLLELEEGATGRGYWTAFARGSEPSDLTDTAFVPRASVHELTAETTSLVAGLAAALQVPPASVLLACWYLLLARTGHSDAEVGVAFDGRVYEGLPAALGPFTRYLPVRLSPSGTFSEAALAAAAALAEHAEWQDYFDPAGTQDEGARRFAFGFDSVTVPDSSAAAGLTFRTIALQARTERFDLRLSCNQEAGRWRLIFEHDASRISADRAGRTARRFLSLLAVAARRPDTPVDDLEWLPAAEREEVLALGRATTDAPAAGCIHTAFEVQATRTPERPAVAYAGQSLTFLELNRAANQLAHRLRELGVRPESAVGLDLERSMDWLVGTLGILKAGGVLVPLDPTYPPGRITEMLRRAGVGVVVTTAALRTHGLAGEHRTLCLDRDFADLADQSPENPEAGVQPDHAAYVIFTSGSAGRPKGVLVQHGAVMSLSEALEKAVYRGREGLHVSLNAPLAFDGSVKQWIQLLRGHTVHVVPEEDRLSPERLLARLRSDGIQVLDCTPTHLRELLRAGLGDREEALRLILCGGEAMDPALWSEVTAQTALEVFNVYGPTEFTVDATAAAVRDHASPTLGRPLPGAWVRVLDRRLRAVPLGVDGEVCLAGARCSRGYVGEPARTAERFVPDPFSVTPGSRLYLTGDRGRWREDGTLEFLGRGDDQVKIRGVRIELGEIESLLREDPRVAGAVAAVLEADEEAQIAVWFVSRTDPGGPDEGSLAGELRERLRANLPEFMVPAWIVPVPEIPRSPSGKADRRALPDPRTLRTSMGVLYVGPATEMERTVAVVWQEVLGVERVSTHDNFFDLGGNSLLAVQVYERLVEAIDAGLTVVELFRYPTVALLAERLSVGRAADSDPLSGVDARARRQREALERERRPGDPTPATP